MKWSRRKRILLIAGVLFGALVLLGVSLPVWWPLVFRPIAGRYGLTYARYERIGYARFEISNVRLTNGATTFHAKSGGALVPTVWLWRRFIGPADPNYLRIDNWQLRLEPAQQKTNRQPESASSHFQTIKSTIAAIQDWIPRAELVEGALQWDGQTIQLPQVSWTNHQLSGRIAWADQNQVGAIRANLPSTAPYEVFLDVESLPASLSFRCFEDASGLNASVTGVWLTNRIEGTAHFGREGVWPETARVTAEALTVPARVTGLEAYDDLKADLSFIWSTNRYVLNLTAAAPPRSTNLPPVSVVVRASGDLEAALIEHVRIFTPSATAEMTNQTRLQFRSPFLTEDVTFKWMVELAGQRWVAAKGQIRGEALFRAAPGVMPPVLVQFSGENLHLWNLPIKNVDGQSTIAWPWLTLTNARVELPDGSIATIAGKVNLKTGELQVPQIWFDGRLSPPWVPLDAPVSCDRARLNATLEGDIHRLVHAGSLTITNLRAGHPDGFDLAMKWRATNLDFEQLQATIGSQDTSLQLEGSAKFGSREQSLRLATLTLRQKNEPQLALEKPLEAILQSSDPASGWSLSVRPFEWGGAGGHVRLAGDVQWPKAGKFSGAVRGVKSGLVTGMIGSPFQHWEVGQLDFSAGWSNGPAQWAVEFERVTMDVNDSSFATAGKLNGSERGLLLERWSLVKGTESVATASGFLPIVFHPAQTNIVVTNPDERVQLDVLVNPEVSFWNQLAERGGVRLQRPELEAHATGTWAKPSGRVQLRAREIKLKAVENEVPPIENLNLDLHIAPDLARLEKLTLFVANQPVVLSGHVPLADDFWKNLPNEFHYPDWRKATARMDIDHAQVAALTPFLADVLAPGGTLTANLALEPGGKFDGRFAIEGVNTRPFESVGAIHNVEVTGRFNGERIDLESRASIGGQLATANGFVDLREQWPHRGPTLPPFQLRLRGSNVPLTRQVEAIMRADLDVTITNAPRQTPVISGDVHLRNSIYLQDLAALAPSVTTARRRPPYFSIEREPFADWRLNIAVNGEQFLKIRTPLFRGQASANIQLTGTLQNPMAIGEVRVPSGTVRLPFATLPITQAFATLSSANPYQPQLYVTAGARVFGYDVKMEVTGPAHQPVIQFTSTPPLSSEQILLMLMAGELPRQELTLTGEQRAQTMALYLGKSVLSELGFLTGDANRLTFRSGENISEAGKPTYSVEYKLNDDWAVIGEYDRFNDYNLMLKWRVYPW